MNWMRDNNNCSLIFDAQEKKSFHSKVHNTDTNPDLCFVNENLSKNGIVKTVVGNDFPRSQHRPIFVDIGLSIHLVHSFPKSRWNFNKANWEAFSEEMEHTIQFIHPCRYNYNRFCNVLKSIAKKHMPRGFRENYIPG